MKLLARQSSFEGSYDQDFWLVFEVYKDKDGYRCKRIMRKMQFNKNDSIDERILKTIEDVKLFFGHSQLALKLYRDLDGA